MNSFVSMIRLAIFTNLKSQFLLVNMVWYILRIFYSLLPDFLEMNDWKQCSHALLPDQQLGFPLKLHFTYSSCFFYQLCVQNVRVFFMHLHKSTLCSALNWTKQSPVNALCPRSLVTFYITIRYIHMDKTSWKVFIPFANTLLH